MKDDYATNSHFLSDTFLLKKLGECTELPPLVAWQLLAPPVSPSTGDSPCPWSARAVSPTRGTQINQATHRTIWQWRQIPGVTSRDSTLRICASDTVSCWASDTARACSMSVSWRTEASMLSSRFSSAVMRWSSEPGDRRSPPARLGKNSEGCGRSGGTSGGGCLSVTSGDGESCGWMEQLTFGMKTGSQSGLGCKIS